VINLAASAIIHDKNSAVFDGDGAEVRHCPRASHSKFGSSYDYLPPIVVTLGVEVDSAMTKDI